MLISIELTLKLRTSPLREMEEPDEFQSLRLPVTVAEPEVTTSVPAPPLALLDPPTYAEPFNRQGAIPRTLPHSCRYLSYLQ